MPEISLNQTDNTYSNSKQGSNQQKGAKGIVEELQGAKGKATYADAEADYIGASSLCNGGFYENAFGWGEATWLCHGGVDTDCPLTCSYGLPGIFASR
ncbi:hypothetical protein Leryth_004428 [Lithospermum erythrorhizon]|nr:hypothetical protein Leryth_004428 [Lithospermum erythrorhizon]